MSALYSANFVNGLIQAAIIKLNDFLVGLVGAQSGHNINGRLGGIHIGALQKSLSDFDPFVCCDLADARLIARIAEPSVAFPQEKVRVVHPDDAKPRRPGERLTGSCVYETSVRRYADLFP